MRIRQNHQNHNITNTIHTGMAGLLSLLDVMLLLLFWVTIRIQETQAQLQVDMQAQLMEADKLVAEASAQVDAIRAETEEQIAGVWQTAEELNQKSFANQKAMDNFAAGNVLTIYLEYAPDGMISVTEQRSTLAVIALEESEAVITEEILNAIQASGMAEQDIILCALIYDGDMALYKDILRMRNVMNAVGQECNDFYCAMLNTANRWEESQSRNEELNEKES